ncbi:MAG: aminotransferase class IV [Saprospiraceae bacterium]|nr:aminotransferase class IV [Saprospiraceae bacterium]
MTFNYQLINGEIYPRNEAKIPLNDLGMLRSYSIFDFFRVLDGKPVFIEDHIDRLWHSADVMDLALPWSKADINEMCRALVAKNQASDAGMRVVVTGGYAEDGYTPTSPNIYMMLHTLPQYDETLYTQGSKLISTPYMRDMPSVKTTIYIQSIHFKKRMQQEGAVEVLYHWQGNISECSRSNIFFVDADDTIITPKHGMLRGITRKQVLDLVSQDYIVDLRPVGNDEIGGMREAFITSTTKGVMPVRQIDDVVIGNGHVGPVTKDLMRRFEVWVERYLREH